jgi:hypothetical protein
MVVCRRCRERRGRRWRRWSSAVALGSACLSPAAARGDDAGDLAALRARVDALEARADDQQKRLDAPPLVRFSGYVQLDWTMMDQSSQDEIDWSTGKPLNNDHFTLRRGHLRAETEQGLVSGALEIDANTVNGPQVRPIDAEVRLGWPHAKSTEARVPWFEGSLGLMKIPFGFEVPELDNVRPFLERASVLRGLFPGEFDLGVRLRGRYRWLEYALALMNGHPIGESTFPDVDPLKAKDMVGRVGVDTEIAEGVRLLVGVSAETGTGFHQGTPPTKDQLVWRDVNEDGIVEPTEIQVIPGQSATASQPYHRFALGGDLRVIARTGSLGDLTLRAEIVWGTNLDRGLIVADPVAEGRDLRELGWYVGGTQDLGPWVTVGVRYDRYNPDADAQSQRAANLVPFDTTFSTIATMAMVHRGLQRLLVEYDKNTNALGIDATGAPTTLASDVVTLRGQVSF